LGDEKMEIVHGFCEASFVIVLPRHLICLFVIAGNICRKKPKTNGLKTKRNSKQLSLKDMSSKQMSLKKPEILFFFF